MHDEAPTIALGQAGCAPSCATVPLEAGAPALPAALASLCEILAEKVHSRWIRGRVQEGWKWGPVRDDVRKEHPCLVPYEDLPDSEREFDRQTVTATLEALQSFGYRFQPAGAAESSALTVQLKASAGTEESTTAGSGRIPGQLLGKYQLVQPLGAGGFGEVWLAKDTGITQREVALKSIRLRCDTGQREALMGEARIMARIFHHPNFPVLYDVLEIAGDFILVVEYLPGCDLDAFLVGHEGPLEWPDVRNCMAGILAGLRHAHRYGVLHGDLKPRNIRIFNPFPQPRPIRERDVKILDFGLGVLWKEQAPGELDAWLACAGPTLAGTPEYMSPEQARGEPLTPASDLYAAGLILYEMITRQQPFRIASGGRWEAHLEARRDQKPLSPKAWRPELPDDLVAILEQCLTQAPADRFPDVPAMETALLPILDRLVAEGNASGGKVPGP